MKRTILAELKCLPKLVNSKVIVINDDNTYSPYAISRFCKINDDYNPVDYCLLITNQYSCIVYSNKNEKEQHLVNEQTKQKYPSIRVGDKIHLHSRMGMYTISEIRTSSIVITCNRWQYTDNKYIEVQLSDFKCLAGGYNNAVFE